MGQALKKVFVFGQTSWAMVNFRMEVLVKLRDENFEVFPVFFRSDKSSILELERRGFSYFCLASKQNFLFPIAVAIYTWRFLLIVKAHKPAIVLSFNLICNCIAGFSNLINRKFVHACLITGLGRGFLESQSHGAKVRKIFFWWMLRFCLQKAGYFIFQNETDSEDFVIKKITNPQAKSLVVGGSGVNLRAFPPSPLPDKISFLMACRLLESKGVCIFIEAASIIKKKFTDVEFTLVGYVEKGGLRYDDLKNLCISASVKLIPGQDNIKPLIQNHSVVVHPSYYREGLPRILLEALSSGRAIITTDAPGCKEAVLSGKNGYLCRRNDVASLVSCLEKMIRKPTSEIRNYGKSSRELAETRFDSNKVAGDIVDLLTLN